jgi:hypothetical protein
MGATAQALCVGGRSIYGPLDSIHAWGGAHGNIQAGPADRHSEAAAPFHQPQQRHRGILAARSYDSPEKQHKAVAIVSGHQAHITQWSASAFQVAGPVSPALLFQCSKMRGVLLPVVNAQQAVIKQEEEAVTVTWLLY